MENNLVGAKSRGFMVGMGPHSFPSVTIPTSFKGKDSGNPPLCYQIQLTSSLAQFLILLEQPPTSSTLLMHWAKPALHQLYSAKQMLLHHRVYSLAIPEATYAKKLI